MALGMDNKLKSFEAPAYMKTSDTKLTGLQNNLNASTKGAGQAAMQKMGGRGMSRGRGQEARGERAQNTANIKGALAAGKVGQQASQADNETDLAYNNAIQNNMQQSDGLLNGLSQGRADGQHAYGQASNSLTGLGNNAYSRDWQSQVKPDTTKILRYLMG
jgi:hypothetical protein